VGKEDDSRSDADKFAQSNDGIGPVVDRQDAQGRVEALVGKR
jgi:hypothetical protein